MSPMPIYEEILELTEKRHVNVGRTERWLSVLGGAFLAVRGLSKKNLSGAALAAAGGYLVYRGQSGHCPVYEGLGITTSRAATGLEFEDTITLNRPVNEVYKFWRNLENLPDFMEHLEAVKQIDNKLSHWVARIPGNIKLEWDAEITDERENEFIGWRSLPDSDIRNEGIVMFRKAPGDRGTEVKLHFIYYPPLAGAGKGAIRLLDAITFRQIHDELRKFKQIMETGEIPTAEGRASGA
ncbi:MAG: DUF2892 domain-containing protein [Deltaproteobacteria bacterium]|nr:DUF2892 domain-containing protein [Deltaproteobacteria bacterium]